MNMNITMYILTNDYIEVGDLYDMYVKVTVVN